MANEITWVCNKCSNAIEQDGWITVSTQAIRNYAEGKQQFEKDHPFGDSGYRFIKASEYQKYPAPAQWTVRHARCIPANESRSAYEIETNRVRTPWALLDWTAHLMGKVWLEYTDWAGFLYRVLRNNNESTDN